MYNFTFFNTNISLIEIKFQSDNSKVNEKACRSVWNYTFQSVTSRSLNIAKCL
jgi:hypothetical protein